MSVLCCWENALLISRRCNFPQFFTRAGSAPRPHWTSVPWPSMPTLPLAPGYATALHKWQKQMISQLFSSELTLTKASCCSTTILLSSVPLSAQKFALISSSVSRSRSYPACSSLHQQCWNLCNDNHKPLTTSVWLDSTPIQASARATLRRLRPLCRGVFRNVKRGPRCRVSVLSWLLTVYCNGPQLQ